MLNLLTNDPERQEVEQRPRIRLQRAAAGASSIFGGVSIDRTTQVACDDPTNPNNLLYCDQSKSNIPWLANMKLSASIPLRYGISVGAAFQSYKYILIGGATIGNTTAAYGTQWLITPTTRYAANCPGPCTPGALVDPGMTVASLSVPLVAPATESTDRINQLDINVGKSITVGAGEAPAGIHDLQRAQQSRGLRVPLLQLHARRRTSSRPPSCRPAFFGSDLQVKW